MPTFPDATSGLVAAPTRPSAFPVAAPPVLGDMVRARRRPAYNFRVEEILAGGVIASRVEDGPSRRVAHVFLAFPDIVPARVNPTLAELMAAPPTPKPLPPADDGLDADADPEY